MKNKLKFLVNTSLKKKIKSKWFLVANLIIAVIIIAVINIDSIITLFGGDFNKKDKIYMLDETNEIYENFKQNLGYYENTLYGEENESYEVILENKSLDDLKKIISEDEKDSIIIQIYYNKDNKLSSKLISLSTMDTYDYQLISNALMTTTSMYTLNSIGLSEEQYNKIINGVEVEREILDENITSEDEDTGMIMTTVFPVLILPFFMLTIFLVQFIGSEVNDEKSTKSMEIIISNVSPKIHFAAKIIANNLFIFAQVVLIVMYAVIGFGIRKVVGGDSIINGIGSEVGNILKTLMSGALSDKFIFVLILTIVLMLLTFIAYSLIAGILASMTTNAEDYQQVQVPIMITLLLGYYLSIMAGMFKGALFIKVLSFVPFISAILSPSLLILGQIGVIEMIISIVIMVLTVYLLMKYGLRIYKVGILNYSSTGMWKKMFSSIKNK